MPLTMEQMIARIAELEKTVANKKAKGTGLKVSTKGAVSFYGVGRFPVTLYSSQWETVAENLPKILTFIAENKAALKVKPVAEVESTETAAV